MDGSEKELNKPIAYQVKIRGHLNVKWAEWLCGKNVKINNAGENSAETTIYLIVPDQAALRGVLNKIWDLNLTLISVSLSNGEMLTHSE